MEGKPFPAGRQAGPCPEKVKSYCCITMRVGTVAVGVLTMTSLILEIAMPTTVPAEEPVLKVPSEFREMVSEVNASAVWLVVEALSVVPVKVPLLVKVRIPTSVWADWLTTSEVPTK